jgi:hypothetical protein
VVLFEGWMLGFNPLDDDSSSLLLAAAAVTPPTSSDTNDAVHVGVDASGETAVSVATESHLHEQKQVIENIKVSLGPYFV